ncbi:hypothetical protein KIPE111705_29600 [Kibdelosporangium persicum]|uniref:hypothetical protein n=1 Tax=Kibdelosporangium persicum TaxID=2698649 RepID=UPI00156370EF|nr:hypothetical protein [Kibdelosporangium persicum]
MRRRLSWAAVGTSGVLAVIVATTMNTPPDSEPRRTKITVPQAEELNGHLPRHDRGQPETVFIPVVPPVAVTSATSTVPSPPKPAPKPKKTPPSPPPPPAKTTPPRMAPATPSYWDHNRWMRYHRYGDRGWHRDRHGGGYR